MKINKTIIIGILFILLSVFIFFNDSLNGIIRPITYLFLTGSSKGKDILFFGIFGFLILISQLHKTEFLKNKFNKDKNYYLKIAIVLGLILGAAGILIEVYMRMIMNIDLNTIFVALKPTMTSTSILHSHIYKSILGEGLSSLFGSFIPSKISIGNSLYQYVPKIAILLVLIFPIILIFLIISLKKRTTLITLLLSFFGTCALIGLLDGGLFSLPAILGLGGLTIIFRNEGFLNHIAQLILKNKEDYLNSKKIFDNFLHNFFPYLVILIIIALRISITFIGANSEYYEVNIENLNEDLDFSNNYSVIKINQYENKTTILISPEYNEMELLNNISRDLENKSDYLTMSWNGFSYI